MKRRLLPIGTTPKKKTTPVDRASQGGTGPYANGNGNGWSWLRNFPRGLSGKLLLLTILFVLLAEVLTFVPSVSNFRRNWLQERLTAAQIAALSAEAAPNNRIPRMLRDELLRTLRLQYNRARQSAITTEILEIISGANALEAS